MKTLFEFLKNPFYRVAGYTSLAWGVVGIVISTAIAFLGDIHFHGLLHYGGAPNGAWWCFVVEHLVVWLVPSVLIYLSALFCSRSHVRPVDVLGTSPLPTALCAALALHGIAADAQGGYDTVGAGCRCLTHRYYLASHAGVDRAVSLLLSIWCCIGYSGPHRVACNLKGRNLWIVLLSVLLAEMFCVVI